MPPRAVRTQNAEQTTERKQLVKRGEIARRLHEAASTAALQASTQVMEMASKTAAVILDDTKKACDKLLEEINLSLATNQKMILEVTVNGESRKLAKRASPYLERAIVYAKLGFNTLLVGPAGSGKTILAAQVAEALERKFYSVNLTAGASETWLLGRQTPTGFVPGPLHTAFKEGGVLLLDEMDAADPNTLLVVNTAIANGMLYNPMNGEQVDKHPDFILVAGANTIGKGGDIIYSGRNRLDAATLDRFEVIMVDYSPEIEEDVCPDKTVRELLQSVRAKLRAQRSDEVISTRRLERTFQSWKAGVPAEHVLESLTAGWTEELKKNTGIFDLASAMSRN